MVVWSTTKVSSTATQKEILIWWKQMENQRLIYTNTYRKLQRWTRVKKITKTSKSKQCTMIKHAERYNDTTIQWKLPRRGSLVTILISHAPGSPQTPVSFSRPRQFSTPVFTRLCWLFPSKSCSFPAASHSLPSTSPSQAQGLWSSPYSPLQLKMDSSKEKEFWFLRNTADNGEEKDGHLEATIVLVLGWDKALLVTVLVNTFHWKI